MQPQTITPEFLTEDRRSDVHEYLVDASDLGLPPGLFPTVLAADPRVGNGLDFVLAAFNPSTGEHRYRQDCGAITLRVAND